MKPVVTPSDSTRHQPPPGTSTEPKELLLGKDGGTSPDSRSQPDLKASEAHIDIAEVIGSIPIAPTTIAPTIGLSWPFPMRRCHPFNYLSQLLPCG